MEDGMKVYKIQFKNGEPLKAPPQMDAEYVEVVRYDELKEKLGWKHIEKVLDIKN